TRTETEQLNAEREKLAHAVAERQKLQAQLSAHRPRAEEKIAALSRESESLQILLKTLENEEKAEEAREKQPAKSKSTKRFDGSTSSLRTPVTGAVLHKFGDKKSANEDYRGTVIRTRAGSTVVAPYDGEVVFTGPFRD